MDLRSELTDVQAEKVVVEQEVHEQLLQLHAMQLKLQAKGGQAVDSDSIKDRMVGTDSHYYKCSRTDWVLYIDELLKNCPVRHINMLALKGQFTQK